MPWTRAACDQAWLRPSPNSVELWAACPNDGLAQPFPTCSGLDLNACFVNDFGTMSARVNGSAFETCSGCIFFEENFVPNNTVMSCNCKGHGGQEQTAEVALDDAIWVDQNGFLRCFEAQGYYTGCHDPSHTPPFLWRRA
ncbi:hypothetical protein E8E14_003654 [Neopestalotiopsis sp. 37M]|nr:hypothetical protein E8E14_003654 [Neopestalotiopsis sp. 37M]